MRNLFLLSLLLFFMSFRAQGGECKVRSVEVVRSVYGSGYVKSERQVLVRAGVSGYVKRLLADRGQRVSRGELLAVIESPGLEEKISALSQRIRFLEERLKEDSGFMKSIRHTLRLKEENTVKARKRFERRKRLYERGVIPKEALEEAERTFVVAREDYRTTLFSLKDKVREMETELSYLREEKKALEKELDRYRIRSPIDGVVLRRFVEEGDYVNHISRENALFSVGSSDRKVVLSVDEEFAPLVKAEQKVYVTTDAAPGMVFEGKVVSFDLESEMSRRVVEVEVEAPIPPSVPVNSVVEGNIVVSRLKTTVVPIEAVKDGFAVLLVKGEKKRVKVNRLFDRYAEVLGYPVGTPCLISE